MILIFCMQSKILARSASIYALKFKRLAFASSSEFSGPRPEVGISPIASFYAIAGQR